MAKYLLECEIVGRMISISSAGNSTPTYLLRVNPAMIFRQTSLIGNSRNYGIAVEELSPGSFNMKNHPNPNLASPPRLNMANSLDLKSIDVDDHYIAELPVDTSNPTLTSAISGWQSGLAVLELDDTNTVIGIKI